MKRRSILQVSVLATILALSLAASAADKATTTSLDLLSPVQVNGQQLKEGTYKVKIVRNGSDAEVTLQRGKTSVTTHGQFVDDKDAAAYDTYLVREDGGARKLIGLKFEGKKETLMLSDSEASSGMGH